MLKILLISHGFHPDIGGIETNTEILATGFCNLGADVHLVTWTKAGTPKKFPFRVIRNPGIKQLINEHHWCDVILENNPCLRLSWPNIFIRKPLVVALNTWVTRLSGKKGWQDKLKYAWFKRAKKMIAVSDAIRKKEWHDAVVIENPYNDNLFRIKPGIEKKIMFVFLGRLVSDKGADQAIKAVSKLHSEKLLVHSPHLTIIGEGPEKNNLAGLVDRLKMNANVHFTGPLQGEALVDCLNKHQYILVPSAWEEPYGNVVLEALACGCIPVASDGGGLPEAVNGSGYLFKRNDIDDMVRVLKTVLNNNHETKLNYSQKDAHLKARTMDKVSGYYLDILKAASQQ